MNKMSKPHAEDAESQSRADWLQALDDIGEERGHFQPLGPNHSAIFTDESPTLLVSFEIIEGLEDLSSDGLPLGFELVEGTDWSQLCLLSHGDGWFRDHHVYGYFDRLIDDGFFDDFDRVIFYGAGPCGYAAAAFSVAAPGATVICIQPQATLDPAVVDWDQRFPEAASLDFTGRYAYAPDMLGAADRAYILFDPDVTLDARHAALFDGAHIEPVSCRFMGPDIQGACLEIDILKPMLLAAGQDGFEKSKITKMLRKRRDFARYREQLIQEARRQGKPRLTQIAAQRALADYDHSRIVRKAQRWSANELNRRAQEH